MLVFALQYMLTLKTHIVMHTYALFIDAVVALTSEQLAVLIFHFLSHEKILIEEHMNTYSILIVE